MTFIIILMSFIMERFFDCGHLRNWRWFLRYQTMVTQRLSSLPSVVILIILVAVPMVVVAGINFYLTGLFFNFFKLAFGSLVLLYCLGPKNFWAQTYQCIELLHTEDTLVGRQKVEAILGKSLLGAGSPTFHQDFTQSIFVEANRRLFAVFFWFLILGPVGALLYRMMDLLRQKGIQTQQIAGQCQRLLDWLPVRFVTLIFALAGHFAPVLVCWRKGFFQAPMANDALLIDCGIAAIDVGNAKQLPVDGSAEKETLALLDRACVILLVILAIVVLLG